MVVVKKFIVKLAHDGARIMRIIREAMAHHPKALFLAGVILGSFIGYTISVVITESSYRLSSESVQLIGGVNAALADKLKLDKGMDAYRFNAEAITPEMAGESDPSKVAALLASQKQQTGGGGKESQNLYSLDLPVDPSAGVKIYDINSKTSFKLIPEFDMNAGRSESGRVVYPLDGGGQAIYTVKANGIKEDIVLQKPRGNTLSFAYKLELPKTLEARLDDSGNLGIYSADPAITSAIAGSLDAGGLSADTARLKDVQENGTKNHLAYLIPAPTIVQSGDQPAHHKARAIYKLEGDTLTVSTSGLQTLTYPISIDPSVVVTSTADFATGNDEGNISFDVDAISRAKTGEPTIGAWTATTNLAAGIYDHATVTYNGRMYVIGGRDTNGAVTSVRYASINADGTVGSWTATTSLVEARYGLAAVVYSGYLYVLGGTSGSGSVSTVRYAPINADGTVGTWVATTALADGRADHAVTAYNGHLYVTGGWYFNGATTSYNKVSYAPLNGDGTIGAWSYTTVLPTARHSHTSMTYAGNLYVIGGTTNGSSYLANVQYAPIGSDGSIGSWTATTSLPYGVAEHDSFVYGGYLYRVGGTSGSGLYTSTVYYAPMHGDGSIGSWTMTTSLSSERYGLRAVAYAGRIYAVGGNVGGTGPTNLLQRSTIDTTAPSVINMSSWSPTTTLGLSSGSATARAETRQEHSSVAYNGHLYVIGGRLNATTPLTSVHSAPINANGTVGTWTATGRTALPAARYGHTSAVVNGYLYVVGGQDNSNAYVATAYYALIGAGGDVGSWATTNALPAGRAHHGMTNYNGYMYVASGYTSTGVYTSAVHYAAINANGTLGTWTATTVGNADEDASLIAYNGYLYLAGYSLYYAPINANGTVGTWEMDTSFPGSTRNRFPSLLISGHIMGIGGYGSSTPINETFYSKFEAGGTVPSPTNGTSFATARYGHAVAMHGDHAYITGGAASAASPLGDVQYASVVYGPAPSTTGSTATWQSATASNLGVYGHASVVYNNFIYIIGGFGGGAYRNEVRYAPLNADGTIGTWVTAPSTMSLVRFNAAASVHGGRLYVSGGQQAAGVFTNTVEYAQINADGSIGTWTTSGNTFATARYGHVSAAYNGKLYVVGGGDSANVALSDVKYTTINADGSIGTWSDTTATTANRDTDGFVYGGRLYVLGGVNGTTYSNTVRYATINANGTLGTWTTSGNVFATARSRLAATAVNGYMYISGGGTSGLFGDLQYAQINVDGSISAWKTSNSRSSIAGGPATFAYHTLTSNKGRLYELGGIDGGNVAQTASYATVVSAPVLSGTYSRQVNLGQLSTLNSIVMNGLVPPAQSTLMFRTAGTNGVYGTWQSPSVLSGTPVTNVQYVMYRVAFDDSLGTGYSATTAQSSVTDVTLDYAISQTGVSPDVRLRHNKYFNSSEVLQPLETQ